MLGVGGKDLSDLQAAVHEFQARQERPVDLRGLRSVIDALEAEFSEEARRSSQPVSTWLTARPVSSAG